MRAGDVTFVEYAHPMAGFTLPLPVDWDRFDDVDGVALVALAPARDQGFRANLVVTIERLPPGITLERWVGASIDLLQEQLAYFQPIDQESTSIDHGPAIRILAHHAVDQRAAVTLEQWLLMRRQLGYTLTASVGTLEYGELAGLFAASARGFRVDPGSST